MHIFGKFCHRHSNVRTAGQTDVKQQINMSRTYLYITCAERLMRFDPRSTTAVSCSETEDGCLLCALYQGPGIITDDNDFLTSAHTDIHLHTQTHFSVEREWKKTKYEY